MSAISQKCTAVVQPRKTIFSNSASRKRHFAVNPFLRLTSNVTHFCIYRQPITFLGSLRNNGEGESESDLFHIASKHWRQQRSKKFNLCWWRSKPTLLAKYGISRRFSHQYIESGRVHQIKSSSLTDHLFDLIFPRFYFTETVDGHQVPRSLATQSTAQGKQCSGFNLQ